MLDGICEGNAKRAQHQCDINLYISYTSLWSGGDYAVVCLVLNKIFSANLVLNLPTDVAKIWNCHFVLVKAALTFTRQIHILFRSQTSSHCFTGNWRVIFILCLKFSTFRRCHRCSASLMSAPFNHANWKSPKTVHKTELKIHSQINSGKSLPSK